MTILSKKLMIKTVYLLIVLTVVLSCRRVKQPAAPTEVITTKSGIEMVKIPEGWFDMGSGSGSPDESPVH
ncbi:MAG: hypothetical protein ACYS80_23525, partial [Planctomycetota bacterium]